mmetsp:Transcript_122088/g.352893  ORF Transcript_122088/g.352893 Transcript_122088/m.352893 type:complete len:85 (-) Transcript_122088:1939-2193(-)
MWGMRAEGVRTPGLAQPGLAVSSSVREGVAPPPLDPGRRGLATLGSAAALWARRGWGAARRFRQYSHTAKAQLINKYTPEPSQK